MTEAFEDLAARLLAERVAPAEGGCLLWTGSTTRQGYPRVSIGGRDHNVRRLAYRLAFGTFPDELDVATTCGHRLCVNAVHFVLRTRRETVLSGRTLPALNAARTECIHGHGPFDLVRGRRRACSRCEKERGRRRRSRCANGHDLNDPANVYLTTLGHRRCRACLRNLRNNRSRKRVAA